MKHLTTAALALLVLSACGSDDEENALDACLQPAFNLESCDGASLDAFAAGGAFNMRFDVAGASLPSTASMRVVPGNPSDTIFLGLTATDVALGNGQFFVSSEYSQNGVPSRWSLVGCRAINARQLQGFFRRCNQGFEPFQGTFTAERLARRDGEQESSGGVTKVQEVALPTPGGAATNVHVTATDAFVVVDTVGIYRFDISNPDVAPRFLGRRLISERTAELGSVPSDVWSDVQVVGDNLYVASEQRGLFVFKLSDAAAPPTVLPANASEAVALSALTYDPTTQRLYGFSTEDGSVTVYSTEGGNTAQVSKFLSGAAPTSGDAPFDGALLGNTLYVSHGVTGVKLLNVSNPAAITTISNYTAATLSRTMALGTVGSSTYAFEAGNFWGSSVRVLDVTLPLGISQVGTFSTREAVPVSQLSLKDNRLYVAYAQDGLRVLDVSNPAQPAQAAYYNTWREGDAGHGVSFIEGATGVGVGASGLVYVSDSTRGLLVFRDAGATGAGGQEGAAR